MNQMLIYLAIGLAVILAGIGGFSAIGKKEKKDLPDSSQRDLVYSCGDEALIQFYEAAATDEEREQIAGFAAELIARNEGRKQAPEEESSDLDNVDMEALRAEMEALGSMTGQIVIGEEEALDLTGAAAGLGLIAAGVAAAGHKEEAEEAEEAEASEEAEEAVEPAPDLDGLGLMFAGVAAAFAEHTDEEGTAAEPEEADKPEAAAEAEIPAEPEAAAEAEAEEELPPTDDLSLADAIAACEEAEPEPKSDLDGLGLMLAGVTAINPAQPAEPVEEAEAAEKAIEEAAETIEEAVEEVEEAAAEAIEEIEETAEEIEEVAEEAAAEAPVEEAPVEETIEEDDELIRAQVAFAEAQTEEPPLKKGPSPEERADFFTKQADAAIAAILGGASIDSLLHLSDEKADAEEDLPFGVEAPAAEPVPAAEDVQVEPAVEDSIAEEAPIEEAPVEEVPAEETPIEEAPVEEAPVEEQPIEETPIEETPVEEAPIEEAPAESVGDLSARIAAEVAALQAATVKPADAGLTGSSIPADAGILADSANNEPPAASVDASAAFSEEAPAEDAPIEEAPVEEPPTEETPAAEAPAADSGELPFDFFGKRDYSGKDGLGVVQEACITTAKAGPAADHAAIATLKAQADGKVQEPSLMVCPYCGSVVDVGSHFCIICGSALDETGAAMAAAVASQAPVQSADALVEPDFESRLEDESLAAEDVDFGAAPEVRIQPGASEENPLELTAAEIAKKEYTQQVATLAEDFADKRDHKGFWELDMTKEAAADHKAGVKFTNQYSTQLPEMLAAQAQAEAAAAAAEAPPIFSEDVVFADPEPEPEHDPLEETMVFSPTDDIMASVRELEKRIMADLDLDIKDIAKK